MKIIYPKKLTTGNHVRIIAPSRSMAIISQETRLIANERFSQLGLEVSFGSHVEEKDDFVSSSIESRVADLHQAFSDPKVDAILTVIGGFNSNQLLDYIDWKLIQNNPKVFCGYSDITVLNTAIFSQTGLVTYYGPHYSSFGQKLYFDYTLDYFKKCLMETSPFSIQASKQWSDDLWFMDQENRHPETNDGFWILNHGEATGKLLGGNIGTLNLLNGTKYYVDPSQSILFLEDDSETLPHHFDRDLQSVIHQPKFSKVRGIVIGRFQKDSKISQDALLKIISSKKELSQIPVIANVDFGHTDPKVTLPIGGLVRISTKSTQIITLLKH